MLAFLAIISKKAQVYHSTAGSGQGLSMYLAPLMRPVRGSGNFFYRKLWESRNARTGESMGKHAAVR